MKEDEEHIEWSVPYYLDASVAVKLAAPEVESDRLREFIREKWAGHFHVTEFAFYETLTVLKQKRLRNELTESGYLGGIATMMGHVEQGLLKIDAEFRPDSLHHFADIWSLAKKHSLDWSDALQIYTVLKGRWAGFRHECTAVFVTTDGKLAKAARAEGLRVWDLAHEAMPPGAR